MLLKNENSIVQSLKLRLTFDDGSVKNFALNEQDIVKFIFNNNGIADTIIGRIMHINTTTERRLDGNNVKTLMIDGSGIYYGRQVAVNAQSILDCDMIERHAETSYIKSTTDATMITNIRVNANGEFEYSSNNGINWKVPKVPASALPPTPPVPPVPPAPPAPDPNP